MYDRCPRFCTMLIALVLVAVSLVLAQGTRAAPWWSESINVESKIGSDRSIQSLDVMYPLLHSTDSLTFTDLRGRVDNDESVEVNLGLAHRSLMADPLGLSEEAVLGLYGFADRLESEFDNVFYQATAGAEYFTRDYSFRVNGYLPENKTADAGSFAEIVQTGNQIYFQTRVNQETALPGYDVELGRTVRFDWGQLYGRASYFHFDDEDAIKVAGSRLRTGVQLPGSTVHGSMPSGSRLTVGAEWQTDEFREEQAWGVFRVRVPFGTVESQSPAGEKGQTSFSPSTGEKRKEGESTSRASKDSRLQTHDSRLRSWQKDRLTERIERDVDIVTGRTNSSGTADTEPAVNVATGRPLNKMAFAQADASGTGTASNPTSLPDALSRAGKNGLIVALPGGDTFTTDGLVLDEGQYLTGGQTTLALRPEGGKTVQSITLGSGEKAVLKEESDASTLVRIDTGTAGQTVHNFTLAGGTTAIRGSDVEDVTVDNVDVSNTSDNALHFNDAPNLKLADVSVTDAENHGVYVHGSRNPTIRDVRVEITTRAGIDINDAENITARNLESYNTGQSGISISTDGGSNNIYENLTADSSGVTGISLSGENATASGLSASKSEFNGVSLTLSNSTVEDVTVDTTVNSSGVHVASSSSLFLEDVTVRDSSNSGLRLSGASTSDITVRDLTVDSAPLHGISNVGADDLIFENVAIRNTGQAGISLDSSSDVSFDDVAVEHAGGAGMEIEGDTVTGQNLSVTDAAGHGFDLYGSNHTYTDLGADSVADVGVNLTATRSSLETVSVTDAASDGVAIDTNDVELTDITVDTAGQNGVHVRYGHNTVTMDDVSVRNTDVEGVYLQGNDTVTADGLTMTDVDDKGLRVISSSGIDLSNVEVTSTAQEGLEISDNSDVTLEGVTVTDAAENGIGSFDNSNATYRDVTIDSAANQGIVTENDAELTLNDLDVRNTGGPGVDVDADTVTVNGASVENISGHGMNFEGTKHTYSDLSADSVAGHGIRFRVSGSDADSVTVTDADQNGLSVEADDVAHSNVTVDTTGNHGINVANQDGFTLDGASIDNTSEDGVALEGSNHVLSDVSVTNAGDTGIALTDADSVSLTGIDVTGSDSHGIHLADSSKVTMSDVTVDTSGDDAVRLSGASDTVSMDSVAITGTSSGDGIDIDGPTTNFTLTDATLRETLNGGIVSSSADSGVTLRNVTVEQTGDASGLSFEGLHDLSLEEVTVKNPGSYRDGIDLVDADSVALDTVAVHDVQGDRGMYLNRVNNLDASGLTATNVDLGSSNSAAISIGGSDLAVSDVTVDSSSAHGVKLGNYPNATKNLVADSMAVSNVDGAGVLVANSADTVTVKNTAITNADTGVLVNLTGAFGAVEDGVQDLSFGPNVEVSDPVNTVFSSIDNAEDLIDPSGTIFTPNGNLTCSIEGNVSGSTLTLDDGTTTKTVNNANCP